MAERPYDLVIFGASGFTGKFIAREVVQSGFKGTWALSGRSRERLEAVLTGLGDLGAVSTPDIVIADLTDPPSLLGLALSSKVLISAVGPYRFMGMPVAEAAVEGGCDYLDICGEPDFLERAELELSERAKVKGAIAISAVGFDSVPGDVGAQAAAALVPAGTRVTQIDSVVSVRGGAAGFVGHYATFEAAVHGFSSADELRRLRKRAAEARAAVGGLAKLPPIPGPRPKRPSGPTYDARLGLYTLPFPGADASVIRRTWLALAGRSVAPAAHTSVSFTLTSKWHVLLMAFYGSVFSWLAARPWGRRLLLAHPGLFTHGMFSHEGPTPQQVREARFAFVHTARGYSPAALAALGASPATQPPPDVERTLAIRGPDPGYVSCAIFAVAAAVTLLDERDAVLAAAGGPGVHTPGAAFRGTSYADRVRARGIFWDEVQGSEVPSILK